MSLFRLRPPEKEKQDPILHPWSNTIRNVFSNRIKYAHNSIHNPKYPVIEEKNPDIDHIQFTIVGDRITKEFIYCTNLVKGLHKYRWKKFDAPIIRGVTTVEWPTVWNDLKVRYGGIAHCLKSSVAVLVNDNFIGGEKELKEFVDTKYIYQVWPDYYDGSISAFARFIRASGRACAYMHISIDSEHVGTLIFMLFTDILPNTCENFLRLCTEKKGGYPGTPVHRIVKDSWIQCGGFGLKNTNLSCENFIVPHDRRGVLGMCNDGRHIDCSTQFFVLLQPAPWMAFKYVAFGQLIEGEETLRKIENVPTYYESPKSDIIIHKSGVFNMECQNIMIQKGAREYIQAHIEDLVALGILFYNALLENVFLEAQMRELERMRSRHGGEDHAEPEENSGVIRTTERFLRNKEDIAKQLEKTQVDTENDNNEFDVESYQYEPEEEFGECTCKFVSPATPPSVVIREEIPYYIELTDVKYPNEVDSNFDLKRFLQGDYCLESDLRTDLKSIPPVYKPLAYEPSDVFELSDQTASTTSLESDERKELKRYLKHNADRVSFAGGIIRGIARAAGEFNLLEDTRKSQLISDEQLRKTRLASMDQRFFREKKESLGEPEASRDNITTEKVKVDKQLQMEFASAEDLEKVHEYQKSNSSSDDDDDDDYNIDGEDIEQRSRHVRIITSTEESRTTHLIRRPTGFVSKEHRTDSETSVIKPSPLARLYRDMVSYYDDETGPTLKDYRPPSERDAKQNLLTSTNFGYFSKDEDSKERYMRHSLVEDGSFDQVMNIQHGKKVARKISSDYVKTIDQIEHRLETSIRSVEYARRRPAISVSQYQLKNKKYQEKLKSMAEAQVETVMEPSKDFDDLKSTTVDLRLPDNTPCGSDMEYEYTGMDE